MVADLDVNENSDIYYQGRYWNDFDVVTRRINERISGDPTRQWFEHFAKVSERTFERALILNCGNGWVERELLSSGLILEAVGIDYSEDLLAQARTAAAEGGLPLTYEKVNVNTAVFPEGEFDLVVNHAAAHHIAAIDRVFRELCRMLPDDGWFVCFDYVGPHRNQYTPEAWEELWAVNRQLPASLRQDLRYPHLPTMLATDPTEAVHSELILDTFHRYFTVGELTPLGGAIAYPLLTHNTRLFDAADPAEQSVWLDRILEADDRFLAGHPDSSLFAYFSGTPDKSVLDQGRPAGGVGGGRGRTRAAGGGERRRVLRAGCTGDGAHRPGRRGVGARPVVREGRDAAGAGGRARVRSLVLDDQAARRRQGNATDQVESRRGRPRAQGSCGAAPIRLEHAQVAQGLVDPVEVRLG